MTPARIDNANQRMGLLERPTMLPFKIVCKLSVFIYSDPLTGCEVDHDTFRSPAKTDSQLIDKYPFFGRLD